MPVGLTEQDIHSLNLGGSLERHFLKEQTITLVRGSESNDDHEKIRIDDRDLAAFRDHGETDAKYYETLPDAAKVQIETKKPPQSPDDLLGRLPPIRESVLFEAFTDLLPGEISVAEIPSHAAALDFEKVFNVKFSEVVQRNPRAVRREELRLKEVASDNLNTYWTQKIEAGGKYNFEVKLSIREPKESSLIQFMIGRDDGDPLYLEQKSKGFRWFSAFNLKLRALGVEPEKIRNLVILIDEPGQGLHEKAQRDVKAVIEELGGKGAQVIYTTHHANLIGTQGNEFARIRLVSNTKEAGTRVETVAQFSSRADIGATDTLSPLVTAMGIHNVNALVERDKKNVVVEGITDHYYLSALKTLLGKDASLHFIPACGVANVPNLVSTLIGWGFDYKAVFDDDADSGRKSYAMLKRNFYEGSDELTHKHVYKIPGCHGIEDIFSPSDFHQFVLKTALPEGTVEINSKLAAGRKEALARLFLDSVARPQEVILSQESLTRIEAIFTWLDQKFRPADPIILGFSG